ncbi:hypothetical protein [Neobacillus sp. Marseille-QA0830]
MYVTLESHISLVPIEIRKDKKHYIIEDKYSGEFFEMPEICIEAIRLMNQGETLDKIEKKLSCQYPEEEVNLLDFVSQLIDLDLIEEIDGHRVEFNKPKSETSGFLWISPKVGKFFFNKFAYLLYIAVFLLNIILFVIRPSLFPEYTDIFVFDVMVLNAILWMAFTFILVLFHEFGHILAMRAVNLPTKLGVGHRLFFVVFETELSSIWKLPSKNRYVLFFAGLCFDNVILLISLICQMKFGEDHKIILGLSSLAVFDIITRIIYQCCIYMKTDLYFVLENVSGCYNLMESANKKIRDWIPLYKNSSQEEVVYSTERKFIFLYTIFYIAGIFLTIALYGKYYVPELLYAGKQRILPGFLKGPTNIDFWDALLFSLQISVLLIILIKSWSKKYQHNKT